MVENTFVDEKQTKTAKEHYELTEHQVEEVSNILLLETSGHPRSLTDAFQSCRTYEQISSYTVYDRPGDDIDWRRFLENFWYFQKPLQVMMNSVMAKQEINLAVRWKDEEEKGFLYDAIAEGFRILWDVTIDKATLFMPRYLQQMIISTVYPLNELLEKVVPAIINIPIDYPDVGVIVSDSIPRVMSSEVMLGRESPYVFRQPTVEFPQRSGVLTMHVLDA